MSLAIEASFYAEIRSARTPAHIEEVYRLAGWSTRQTAFMEFETHSEFAALEIFADTIDFFADNPVLLAGEVVGKRLDGLSTNCKTVVGVLTDAGLHGSYECYDDAHVLLIEQEF